MQGSPVNIFPADRENIVRAAGILKSGGLVGFPTETVYGLGADAFNPEAVAAIFEVKRRPYFDPIIVHIADHEQVPLVAFTPPARIERLMAAFWPGPLTLVMEKLPSVPDIVTAGLTTVAVRMPAHPVALSLIREAGRPVAAPSANLFGRLSPTSASHVALQLGDRVDMILDGGECTVGLESTILKIGEGGPVLLRPGGLPLEEIEKITGKVIVPLTAADAIPEAPGQLPSHYSPSAPLRLIDGFDDIPPDSTNAGVLAFMTAPGNLRVKKIEVLSENGDLREAAARLFSCLHRLDEAGVDLIYAQRVPETGLGMAIMNRLCRAENRNGPPRHL